MPMESADAQLSHAILNPATAAIQGEVAYARALARFTREPRSIRLLEEASALLEHTKVWWSELASGVPLVRQGPEITGDGRRVCEILEEATARWGRLAERVEGLGPEAVDRGDTEALYLLVAATSDHAFYAYQITQGTVAIATIMGDETAEGRGAQRVRACMSDVHLANAMVDQLVENGRLDEEKQDVLAGRSLALPIDLRLRIVEAGHALGTVRGRYDYAEAGIPEAEIDGWKEVRLPPLIAARWHATGFTTKEAVEWMRARLDPFTAGIHRRQGTSLEQLRKLLPDG